MESTQNALTKSDLKKIFDTYYEALVSYGCRFLSLRDECEDLVQDIFVDLWEKDLTFPDETSLKVYLYKVTRNKCFNTIKHSKVKDKYAVDNILLLEDDSLFLEQILEEEIVRQLHKAIELLPDRKKEIIKMSLIGLKNTEIAEALDIKLQTVKTLKSQSYTILRNQFKDLDALLYFLIAQ
ncbi:RNA polymerase sigma-70 factor [Flavobacterium sp. MC2016-06]|uniref:RNA polymerase sigma-70 factor n=1 Tax=Flavobacterium sp. MC2016-06 TaxID=2676308 RepID=UPI0012BB10A8|nr:RNA polymerase sigma-70 factor [Flavobacterium sp. MC2016-06]MBU3861432.1 RNA polymerase sigma-70 factor [Flavobacterium sp. MC2016-06]